MARKDTQFKPGNSGRRKGSAGRFTTAIKERIENVLEELDKTLLADLAQLSPSRRLEVFLQLQEYIRPKLSRTTLAGDADAPLAGVVEVRLVGAGRAPRTSEDQLDTEPA